MDNFIINYGKGAYGNTLLLQINDIESLHMIKNVFNKLADSVISEFSLKLIKDIRLIGIKDVILTNYCDYINTKMKGEIILWEQSETDWYNCVGLIEGLIKNAEAKKGGHQYLTGSEDGIIIKISQNEK